MTLQEQITEMKTKHIEMINQRSQLRVEIKSITRAIEKLETMAESKGNPNLAADLVKPFEVPE